MSQLQFLKLHIENFKTFTGKHSIDLDRPGQLIYITGDNRVEPELGANGAGKSTIWDALTWCLWGRTGRDNRPADAVKPWGGKGTTSVELYFSRFDQHYHLVRRRNPNQLFLMDGRGTKGMEITQDKVPGLLGMSEEMYRRTIVLHQFGELFLDLKPEAQGQMFTEALNLDVWLRASENAAKQAKQWQASLDDLTRKQASTTGALEQIEQQIAASQGAADLFDKDKAARIAKIERGIKTLTTDLAELEDATVKQPTLPQNQELENARAQLREKREAIIVLKKDAEAHARDLGKLEQRNLALKKQEAQPKKRCPECGQTITDEAFAEKLKNSTEELESLATVTDQHAAEALSLVRDAEKIERRITTIEATEAQAVKKYNVLLTAWNEWTAKVRATNAELARQKMALSEEQRSRNTHAELLDTFRKRRADLRGQRLEAATKQGELEADLEWAKIWVDGFRDIRLSIIDETLVELEMATARHAGALGLLEWGVRFDTERQTKSGTTSTGFSVFLYPPGMENPIKWESYSGGESQRLQLAVAFALSEVLLARAGLSPNIEVLDEPTRGLSAGGVGDLLVHLRERSNSLCRSIYFVDHHSLDRGEFDGTLMVEKHRSGSKAKWL